MAIFGKNKNEEEKSKTFASKKEIGASGTTNFQGIIDTDEYVSDLSGSKLYTTVDKMRWSDASVQAALLMCELPIRSAEWDVEAASEDAQDEEIAKFVRDNLFNDLTITWEDVIRQILLMLPYGCMAFEVVYKLTDDRKVAWRKWAPRLPKTIYKWNTDKNGELESITQRTYKSGNFIEIDIPAEKLMVFVHRREGDNYLGTSILRQAYKHWFFRDKYYKIDAVATERAGIGIPKIQLPDGFTDDDYDEAVKVGENLRGHEKAYVVYKEGWEIEMMDMKSQSTKGTEEMLEHHTREILKSVLAQFIDLGSGATGSYALAKDQSKMFLTAIDALAKQIEDVINDEIKKLVDYNWTVEDYPKLTHTDLGIKDVEELSNAIQKLTFAGVITADSHLEDYMRKVLKLPEKPEEVENEQEQPNPDKEPPEEIEEEEDEEQEEKPVKASENYFRELTKAERRVKFKEIEDYLDRTEELFINKIRSLLMSEKPRLLNKFETAIRNKDFSTLQKIALQMKGKYAELYREHMKDLFEYGKLKASYEIKQPAPPTPESENNRIVDESIYFVNYNEEKLLSDLKEISAVCLIDEDITPEQAMDKLENAYDTFLNRNVPASSSLVTSGELNNGRQFTFEQYKDELYGYQWSAILDGRTCNYCASMDGRVIGTEDKAFHQYKPGEVHFHCRCFIDPKVPIYTSKGKKPISEIKVGDLVLTHKGRFRKVTELKHTEKQTPNVTKLFIGSKHADQTVTITDYHPILVDNEWKYAKDIKIGDKVNVLAKKCEYTEELIPNWRKTVNRKVSSRLIAENQWKNESHRKNVSEKNRKSMLEQYENGDRNGEEVTKKANQKTRELVKNGEHIFQDPDVRIKARKAMVKKNYGTNYLEEKIGWLLNEMGINVVSQYPVLIGKDSVGRLNYLFPDFALVKDKIAIECDGSYWHSEEKDIKRDKILSNLGWTVIHLEEDDIRNNLSSCSQEIQRVLANHSGEYKFVEVEVKDIKRWKLKRATKLWNFEVEEDDSYIAGKPMLAVHNCIWVGITKKEVDPPPFTGIPDRLRPQTQMPAWEFKDINNPLPGSGKRKMPYGVQI
jgi:SPP1 gp7 family putative phage head morphogenesis protein